MKGWKAIASGLLVLVSIGGVASAQDWSHQDRRDNNNYTYSRRDQDRDRDNDRYGWQAPHRSRQNRGRDEGYYRRSDGDRDDGGYYTNGNHGYGAHRHADRRTDMWR
jgi:hypothetical protein